MAELQFFNTLSRRMEKFVPLNSSEVLLYTCGPTVYDFAHIGNLRTYVFEDLLRRVLKYFGFQVKQAMNLTDVDDKTIKGANRKKKSLQEYTATYKKAFFEDLKTLNIEKAEHFPEATDYIAKMIEIIQSLLNKGIAYKGSDGSVYFSLKKFPSYGKLSHLNLQDLKKGASQRISADSYEKENVSDFVLWKAYDPERDKDIYWESPFGKGRPGWHIECSAMALALLGKTIDIHCGGVDNIFPHHENEIAQSESFTGNPFVRYWLHSEHLIVEGRKMSKSLQNFYTLRDLLEQNYRPQQIRLMLLQTHYRLQLNFTFEGLKAAESTLERIFDFTERLKQIAKTAQKSKALHETANSKDQISATETFSLDEFLQQSRSKFEEALADDLNISKALASVFELIRTVNIQCDAGRINSAGAEKILALLQKMDSVLALGLVREKKEKIPPEVQEALEKRNQARRNKNFLKADRLRDWILQQGYVIEDTPQGAVLKQKKL